MKHIFLSIALSGIVLPVCAQTTNAGTGAEGEDTSSGIEFIKTADHKDVEDILEQDRQAKCRQYRFRILPYALSTINSS